MDVRGGMNEGRGLRVTRTIGFDAIDLQRRLNANIIAAKVIRRAEIRTCALLIFPDGTSKTVPLEADRLDPLLARNPLSLVGTYDASATLEDVASDVLAMAWSMSEFRETGCDTA